MKRSKRTTLRSNFGQTKLGGIRDGIAKGRPDERSVDQKPQKTCGQCTPLKGQGGIERVAPRLACAAAVAHKTMITEWKPHDRGVRCLLVHKVHSEAQHEGGRRGGQGEVSLGIRRSGGATHGGANGSDSGLGLRPQRGPGNPTEAQDLDRLCNTAHSSHGSAAQHVTE